MRLTINGEQVSYSLENERTLGEVVRSVQVWLDAAGFLITAVRAVGESGTDSRDLMKTASAEWSGTSVESVKELGVQAAHTGELKLAHWRTVNTWLGMLVEEILPDREGGGPGKGVESLESLLADFPETMESLRANPFLPPGSDAIERFDAFFKGRAPSTVRQWPVETAQAAKSMIKEIQAELQKRIADAALPGDALARCVEKIRDSMTRLTEVSILLQTGRDKDAMEIVIGFVDAVQALLLVVPFLAPDPERATLLAEFNPVLKELVGAFGTKDSVLIGDLLEYEIAPRMQRLAPLLEKAS